MESRDKILISSLCNALGPFIIATPCIAMVVCWLFQKNDPDTDVADYARMRLNVSISWTLWIYLSWVLCSFLIGFIPLFVLGIWWVIACVKDVIHASSGDTSYQFPLTVNFLKPRKTDSGEE